MFQPLAGAAPGGARTTGVVVCIGDSLTAGTWKSQDTYPAQLELQLRDAGYKGFAYKNFGVWGEDSETIARRLPQAVSESSRSGPLAFVLVLAGSNDLLQRRPAAEVLERLKRLHEAAARSPGAPCVGVFTIPKCRLMEPKQEQDRVAVNDGLRRLCDASARPGRFLIDLEDVPLELSKDGVHYQGEGYKEFARRAHDSLRSLWS